MRFFIAGEVSRQRKWGKTERGAPAILWLLWLEKKEKISKGGSPGLAAAFGREEKKVQIFRVLSCVSSKKITKRPLLQNDPLY